MPAQTGTRAHMCTHPPACLPSPTPTPTPHLLTPPSGRPAAVARSTPRGSGGRGQAGVTCAWTAPSPRCTLSRACRRPCAPPPPAACCTCTWSRASRCGGARPALQRSSRSDLPTHDLTRAAGQRPCLPQLLWPDRASADLLEWCVVCGVLCTHHPCPLPASGPCCPAAWPAASTGTVRPAAPQPQRITLATPPEHPSMRAHVHTRQVPLVCGHNGTITSLAAQRQRARPARGTAEGHAQGAWVNSCG